MHGKASKENLIHVALSNPQFLVLSGGTPRLTNSQGIPWCASYIHADADLTVDLRSNIASESRAKLVYEYLMQFTGAPYVKDTLSFLMTRKIAHFEMFQAALHTIQPNYPPGVLQADPRFTNQYFNLSKPESARGPWNEGPMPKTGNPWDNIAEPIAHAKETEGLTDQEKSVHKEMAATEKMNQQMSKLQSSEVTSAEPKGVAQWSNYDGQEKNNCFLLNRKRQSAKDRFAVIFRVRKHS